MIFCSKTSRFQKFPRTIAIAIVILVSLKEAFPLNTGKTLPPLISSLILWDLNAKSVEKRLSVSIWVRFRGKILIQCHEIIVRFSFAAWVIKENCYCFYKLWSFEGSHTCAWLRTFRYIKDFLPDKSWVPTRGLISLMQAYHRINNLRWVIDFCPIESNW